MIRPATLKDLKSLVKIENSCFDADRFSARSFRYLLTKANAETLIYEDEVEIRGYILLLFNTGTSLARMYSFAVDPACWGKGVSSALLTAAEEEVLKRECIAMRLEVRRDNHKAIGLYQRHGYRQFDIVPDYYEDHMDALRFEKVLVPHLRSELVRVPYYQQTLDFTCGPSALMMAMKSFDNKIELDRKLELRIWRESTSIFMTSGHGGCGPYGLALSAYRRGFDVELYVNDESALFVDSVRNEEKKEVIRIVQEDFLDELQRLSVNIYYSALSIDEVQHKFEEGAIPLVLISSYRIYREKFPHWVVVTGFEDRYVYVHDSFVDYDAGKTVTDCMNMPILKKDFQLMARYGKAGLKAILILKKRKSNEHDNDE